MKVLIIALSPFVRKILENNFSRSGLVCIQYTNPLKAMDNLYEIDPEVVICSAIDFPRHWKLVLKEFREQRDLEDYVFILSVRKEFEFEEAAKSLFLGNNGLLNEDQDEKEIIKQLEYLFSRYLSFQPNILKPVFIPGRREKIDFVLNHPRTLQLISGHVIRLSEESASFKPDFPHMTSSIQAGTILEECALSLGNDIIYCKFKCQSNNNLMQLDFLDINPEQRKKLKSYLDSRLNPPIIL